MQTQNSQIINLQISERNSTNLEILADEKLDFSMYSVFKSESNTTKYMKFTNLKTAENKANLDKNLTKTEQKHGKKQVKTADLQIKLVENEDANISMIGDSLTISAAKFLKIGLREATIDAQTSRQVSNGIDIIKTWKKNNQMPDYLVFALGTNGSFTKKQGDEIMEILGENTKLVLIYTYSSPPKKWLKSVNETLDYIAEKYPNQVKIADWSQTVKLNSKILHTDGIHPNIRGAKLFTNCIVETINSF